MKDIKKIVLTGGPCAGKTTALVRVIEHFSSLGFKVFTIPEVPTLFSQAGMDYLTDNQAFFYEGEKATLEMQLALEDKFLKMAEQYHEPSLIVCDRGAMDISAYMKPELWEQITKAVGTTTAELRDRRYDAVLHLVSAADGAEQFYTTTNNKQRTEGLELARLLDKKVIEAWTGHPHLRVINNHEDFDNKLNRVLKEISNVLGIPQPIDEERKYIVEVVGDIPDSIDSEITQTYLVAEPDCEVRLRKRAWQGKDVYVHTTKKKLSDKEQLETERQINKNLYVSLLQQADPYRQTIQKMRRSFIWKGQYFELDTFQRPISGLTILETKGVTQHESVKFPPFLKVLEDITGNTKYYNYNIAIKGR
ncbi:AAA family ATPase [Prevotella sp. kh1p2]|uniref:AAA family ATPase n=1 Tax=Prevotella sp. kh1p2 TaxID=1761883 RepID=UPI0008CA6D90|nr:AAA family ATPase [Prevotella sp. kh1p2]SET19031.1 CYTH domain-containing protein [Prevotella sp. kh1p2]SNU12202.1 CYTH domain-containing protein [Prevotellaceae bacterium KH2P17]